MKSGSFSSFQAAAAPEARIGGERDDEPGRRVVIVAEVFEPDDGLAEVLFQVVCPAKGISPLFRFPGSSAHGNPYSLYGKQAAEWCEVPSWNYFTLIVCQTTSGTLLL